MHTDNDVPCMDIVQAAVLDLCSWPAKVQRTHIVDVPGNGALLMRGAREKPPLMVSNHLVRQSAVHDCSKVFKR
jgi:hypothetical protein